MRKLLMSLTILASATLAGASTSHAAAAVVLQPEAFGMPHVQTIQYGEGWRHDGWHRHDSWVRWHRHQEWLRWHRYHG